MVLRTPEERIEALEQRVESLQREIEAIYESLEHAGERREELAKAHKTRMSELERQAEDAKHDRWRAEDKIHDLEKAQPRHWGTLR